MKDSALQIASYATRPDRKVGLVTKIWCSLCGCVRACVAPLRLINLSSLACTWWCSLGGHTGFCGTLGSAGLAEGCLAGGCLLLVVCRHQLFSLLCMHAPHTPACCGGVTVCRSFLFCFEHR